MNYPGSPFFVHHTDHMHIERIHNYIAHRRHFWKIAENSAVALAYDPNKTNPDRFPYPIIGQRWFESLAAGCAVVGTRPQTAEAGHLLDWEDATIEAPDSPEETLALVLALANDRARLRDIRERNVENIRRRHDWRVRFREFFEKISP
jgi:hypothetical protein